MEKYDKNSLNNAESWYEGQKKKSSYFLVSKNKDSVQLRFKPEWDAATVTNIEGIKVVTAPVQTNLTKIFGSESIFNIVIKNVGDRFEAQVVITNRISSKGLHHSLNATELYYLAFSNKDMADDIDPYTEVRVYGNDLKFKKAEYYATAGKSLLGSQQHRDDFLSLANKNNNRAGI